MGDFAELNVRLKLKKDTPMEVAAILEYMASRSGELHALPEHPLFQTQRWESMLYAYSDPSGAHVRVFSFERDKSDKSLFMYVRSVYKDRGEAMLFFDWLYPYIDAAWLEFLGFIKHDNHEHPQLIYWTDEGIRFMAINREEIDNAGDQGIAFNWGITDVNN